MPATPFSLVSLRGANNVDRLILIRVTPKQHEALALDGMLDERKLTQHPGKPLTFGATATAWRALADEAQHFASDWVQSGFGSYEYGAATALRGLVRKINTALRAVEGR